MAKKSFSQHPQKKQVSPMPLPYAHIVSGGPSSFNHTQHMLPDDDDLDLDDICPVCESECTCPKKSAPTPASTATEPSASSTPSSAPSSSNHRPTHAGKNPLKIKLSLAKARKPPPTHPHSASARFGSGTDVGPSSSRSTNNAPAPAAGAPAPKRRGRPPKAVTAAKYNAKKKAAQDDMEYRARGTTGTTAARKVYQPSGAIASTSTADLSDSTLSDYPTFVPAASESTHSSSSESDDSEIESSSDDESMYLVRNDDNRHSTKLLPSHIGQRRRDRGSSNKWEIRPRKKSVGVGEEDDEESSADSGDESEDSSEDGDDENDEEEDADAEADVEGGGLCEVDADLDDEEEETRSCIGITFPGNGWSDDEESSFDADLFFANLDGSSDSGSSSPEERFADLRGFTSDVEQTGSFSADEEDALLLMDMDPSVHLRRADGEFEIGVELDNLSFGWDGQLLFTNSRLHDGLGLSFGMSGPDEDADMFSVSGSDATDCEDCDDSGTGTVVLQESEGDTTEDELVDADGLPNSRAMMLFRWPSSVSAINPLSTVNPFANPPPDASPSTRIALASISSQRRSPPPTPADILAGKISMDDLEDIEMDEKKYSPPVSRRRGVPVMGEFVVQAVGLPQQAAIVGGGREVPSFFPRPVRVARPVQPAQSEVPVEDAFMSALHPPMSTESSDEAAQGHSQQSYTSDLSSTEAIELDDVLDSSLLDSEPSTQECDTDIPDPHSQSSPIKGSHIQSLSRWDRIPMATFRRTRETATASGVDGAASDTGLGALQYRGIGSLIGGTMPLFTPPLDKMSRASARKRKSRHSHSHATSPTLSARDGVLGSPFASGVGTGSGSGSTQQQQQQHGHANKTKKELKKEKAMMKRKLVAKSSQYRYQQPHRAHHHHHHLPNHKSRATSSVQRSNFFAGSGSSIPSLTI
ncbi:hypothetical protein OH77DRAFT_1431872 [Trametes cingulata]|nr:hypothetical protein OH77DRAFT_1431872 [Trametes cingulata]